MALPQFVKQVFESPANVRTAFSLGLVADELAFLIFEKTGIDILGYERLLDNFGVRHSLKNHGNPKTETMRGQIAISPADFDRIAALVSSPDRLVMDEFNKVGNRLLIYEKVISGVRFIYAEEIRPGRRQLVLQTFYKQKIRLT